jgi:hypothetical protein
MGICTQPLPATPSSHFGSGSSKQVREMHYDRGIGGDLGAVA